MQESKELLKQFRNKTVKKNNLKIVHILKKKQRNYKFLYMNKNAINKTMFSLAKQWG